MVLLIDFSFENQSHYCGYLFVSSFEFHLECYILLWRISFPSWSIKILVAQVLIFHSHSQNFSASQKHSSIYRLNDQNCFHFVGVTTATHTFPVTEAGNKQQEKVYIFLNASTQKWPVTSTHIPLFKTSFMVPCNRKVSGDCGRTLVCLNNNKCLRCVLLVY